MKLRPMTMADADKMLEWKNYPETREFAIVSHLEITRENHLSWLSNHIDQFQTIQGSNNTIGAIRIVDNEISIWIDRHFRGSGIASFIIEEVSKPGMIAKIVPGNIASMRAFINAGYKPISFHYEQPQPYIIFKR